MDLSPQMERSICTLDSLKAIVLFELYVGKTKKETVTFKQLKLRYNKRTT
jgi:hypothetical protein